VLPSTAFAEPDTRIVFAGGDDAVSGASIDWTPYGRFSLSNSADEIVLEFDGAEIDRIEWSTGWTLASARSTRLTERSVDADLNDTSAAWCASLEFYDEGPNRGTPGASNGFCPVCGDGFVDPPEECDDGGRAGGDGCDGFCFSE
jgi:cysteine-rich repeat protein